MTQQKMKKVTCCGCFDWLFARRAHHSASEDLDSIVEDIEIARAQDIAGEQGQGSLSLAPFRNAAQPLTGVEEELPSETLDADGDAQSTAGDQNSLVVKKKERAGNSTGAETLIITIHIIKRQVKEQETVAEKDWKQEESDKATGVVAKKEKESPGKKVETLIIILHMVKREKIMEVDEELPSEHQCTAQPHEGVKEELSLEQEEGVDVTEPREKMPLRSSLKKKDASQNTVKKIVRFNFQNLNTFVKDRKLYCGYDYYKYGFPLSSIRSELQGLKERKMKPEEGPVQDAVNKHNTSLEPTVREAACTPMYTTIGGKSPKGILKGEKMPKSTCTKHVRFNFGNLSTPVKEREVYRGHDYCRYAASLEVTQSPNCTSRHHHQPVRSASNSLRGAPWHIGRPTQRSNDSFQQNSGRNAAHSYTNNRHSQHRQHNSSSHVSPRYETRYFYGQTNPGTNSRSRRRAKRGAKPGGGDFL